MTGKLTAVCLSPSTGTVKKNVDTGTLVEGMGLEGDGHMGFGHRQISVLMEEDIEPMAKKLPDILPGSFGENLIVEGLDLSSLAIGDRIGIGESVLGLSQIGKTCHHRCEIYHATGDCIMPTRGLFFKVLSGGAISVGDEVRLL
ncbi:MOSC domain-containing protein [Dethiosulfovibrio salsuginis]|uniref:TatD DNase family protein n=1 Tax=Dethiosulfovibrio salsuginis TaxID=561720 RepID=A0A1X7L4W1_9BACT|nr:MOSC domain-containing protein [Dethiosulfovibrio salsuginis]SMG48891.1 TatD DNase family protein [Dethiosulfovibrio salsuginis]